MRLPLLLDLDGQPVTCVGAGPVAAAKVGPVLACGAVVAVVAPAVDDALEGAAHVHRRRYAPGDLSGDVPSLPRPRLVVAATGVRAVDDAVAAEAAALGIWCLRTDGRGDAAMPAVVRRGGLVVALATGAPALTRRAREAVEEVLDDRWGRASAVLAELRQDGAVRRALGAVDPAERRRRWQAAVEAVLRAGPSEPEDQVREAGRRSLEG